MKKCLVILSTVLFTMTLPHTTMAEEAGPTCKHEKKHKKGQFFQKMDLNGDGQVTETEFIKAAKLRFSKMDKNGDGVITKDERRLGGQKKEKKLKRQEQKNSGDDL